MTGTEEQASRHAWRLIQNGVEYTVAMDQIEADYNLSPENRCMVARALAEHL